MKLNIGNSIFYTLIFSELCLSIFMFYALPKIIPEIAYMYDDGELPFYFYGYCILFLFVGNLLFGLELIIATMAGMRKSNLRLGLHILFTIIMFGSILGVFRYLLITLKTV
ncbi:hypothetical protein DDZ13_09735 [Coraliomargarita sinensis]|uniref:Uncharacterized protein n=1 Tax=Coraliomargarita sinensis TaxID=2174842 RepID=A0A317ZKN9_9BACT|nr:hypothetical protein DDZ13_09735 [Coraliomargarita sinensis]